MKFSILVPVYNVEKYLEECIESLLAQDYKDYEIILVDDGSKDLSPAICDGFAKDYEFIKVVHKENHGLISARRVGLQNASGDYIIFVDSDDTLRKDALSVLAKILEVDYDMVVFRWQAINTIGNTLGEKSAKVFDEGEVAKEKMLEKFIASIQLSSIIMKVCKRELYDVDADYSMYYELKNAEDYFQSIPIMFGSNTFYYSEEALYYYRVNPSSITHTFDKQKYKNLNIIKPRLRDYMTKYGFDNNELIKGMYNTYLINIFDEIFYTGKNKFSIDVYKEMLEFPMIKEAKLYIDEADITQKQKKVIKLFYKENWGVLRLLMIMVKAKIALYNLFSKE